jgi:CRISPR-associated exonuclease Cas4
MNTPVAWLAMTAVLALALGLWLVLAGRSIRRRRGLESGRTLSLDNVTLTLRTLGLTDRPDRLVKSGGTVIPEEWSSWT